MALAVTSAVSVVNVNESVVNTEGANDVRGDVADKSLS